MADPVDVDETFVKKPEDSNDDSLLPRAEGGAPETDQRVNILSAQQPQSESIFENTTFQCALL